MSNSPVFTFKFIKSTMPGLSDLDVAMKITEFVQEGKLEQFVIVKSADGERQLAEFKSMLDVPNRVYDEQEGEDMVVCPLDLEVLYRFPK